MPLQTDGDDADVNDGVWLIIKRSNLKFLFARKLINSGRFAHLEPCDSWSALFELNLVKHVCILEEALFQAHDQELWLGEVLADHLPNILSVTQVQRCIDLIQDVKWCGLILQQRQDQT